MNVVIPMAGEGRRFVEEGFRDPKPFIEVDGKPMIERVLETLPKGAENIILICREEHAKRARSLGASHVITVDETTQGAACTVLLARHFIDNKNPLLIANSDQIVNYDRAEFNTMRSLPSLDGAIFTFQVGDQSKKWSYAKRILVINEMSS